MTILVKMLSKNHLDNFFKLSYKIVGITSISWVVLFIIFHYYLSLTFGYEPSFKNPGVEEYSEFGLIDFLSFLTHALFIISWWLSKYLFPVIFSLNMISKFTHNTKINIKLIAFCLFAYLLLEWLFNYNSPFGGTLSWLFD